MSVPTKSTGVYRIVHTADWHLGKLLSDHSRDQEHKMFLDWLLNAVKRYQVDAVLLAGDVFDTASPPNSALQRYFDFVSELYRTSHCRLIVIAGNHDSAWQLEAPKAALHALNVQVVGHVPEDPAERIILLPDAQAPRVALALIPFLRDREVRVGHAGETIEEIRDRMVDGIAGVYAEAAEAYGLPLPVIATGHLTVLGASRSDSERDIHIGGLGAFPADRFPKRFDYVALGHLHRPQMVQSGVAYAGSPIPLSFSEADDTKILRVLDVHPGGESGPSKGHDAGQQGTKDAPEIVHHELPIPVFRRLLRVRTSEADIEHTLASLDQSGAPATKTNRDPVQATLFEEDTEQSALPPDRHEPEGPAPWVEVRITGSAFNWDLNERVQRAADGAGYEVLQVIRETDATTARDPSDRWGQIGPTDEAGDAADEQIQTLMDSPERVFDRLLDETANLSHKDAEELRFAFRELQELLEHPARIEER